MRAPGQVGYHVWLPMSRRSAEQLDGASQALGILATPPASTSTCPTAEMCGLRLCIGAPSVHDLTKALRQVGGLLGAIEALPNRSLSGLSGSTS